MQTLILRDGYYKCPKCDRVYLIEDSDPGREAICSECGENLQYIGKQKPE